MTRCTMVAVRGLPSPLARPRRRRMLAISAQVWWARRRSISARLAGGVVGFLGVGQGGRGGVPAGFEGAGDESVGGVDGEVAAAGQVGVVAGALDVGGAQRVGFGRAVFQLG